MSSRTYVVTGSASGMGRATYELLEAAGHTVIGVDRASADVVADLATVEGRESMVTEVASRSGGMVDGVIACAGIGGGVVGGDSDAPDRVEAIVRVNYFGAVATLAGLRQLLERSPAPRAATITSIVYPVDPGDRLIAACLDGDEAAAIALCGDPEFAGWPPAYAATKRALARWVRRNAITAEWAGCGIPLNAVGPAVINTPMAEHLLGTEELRSRVIEGRPMPLRGYGEPEHVASLLVWLTSESNAFVTGQIIFADGGNDAARRGDNVW